VKIVEYASELSLLISALGIYPVQMRDKDNVADARDWNVRSSGHRV